MMQLRLVCSSVLILAACSEEPSSPEQSEVEAPVEAAIMKTNATQTPIILSNQTEPLKPLFIDVALITRFAKEPEHEEPLIKAAQQLFADGRCRQENFIKKMGWVESVTSYKDKPIYFTYCAGDGPSDKIYLDASDGRLFKTEH